METQPQQPRLQKDEVADLKATLGARRELGPELEDAVLESFLARVQQRIDAQVEQRLAQSGSRPVSRETEGPTWSPRPAEKQAGSHIPWVVIPAAMGVAIPLVEKMNNAFEVIMVMIAVIVVIVLTFVDRWVQR